MWGTKMRTRDRFPVCAGVDISSGEKLIFYSFLFPHPQLRGGLEQTNNALPTARVNNSECNFYKLRNAIIYQITETSKFRYSVGTIYSYDYTGETASKIGGTSEQESSCT